MRQLDQRIYRTFEEFEREELRRMETVSASVDDMVDALYGQELDFERGERQRRSSWADDDE
jgi:hypothetical protein